MNKKVSDLRAFRSKTKPLSLDTELKIAARYYFDPVRYKEGVEPQILASGKPGPDGSFISSTEDEIDDTKEYSEAKDNDDEK